MTIPQSTPACDFTQEEWRPVVGWEGWYSVSSFGRVRREKAGRTAHAGRVLAGYNYEKRTYHRITLYRDYEQRNLAVHRLVVEAFIGPIPDGKQVNHIDCNPRNNHLENLEIVTPKENIQHALINGLIRRGETHSNTDLTERDVLLIRLLHSLSVDRHKVAAIFGISAQSVSQIVAGRRWKHISEEGAP
jgi:hypothetical protein